MRTKVEPENLSLPQSPIRSLTTATLYKILYIRNAQVPRMSVQELDELAIRMSVAGLGDSGKTGGFLVFPNLPTEIQLKIWEEAVPEESRIVRTFHFSLSGLRTYPTYHSLKRYYWHPHSIIASAMDANYV